MPKKKASNKVLEEVDILLLLENVKTKSGAIRSLGMQWIDVLKDPEHPEKGTRRQRKYQLQDIADALGIRYQNVYNVLKKAEGDE